MARPAYHILKWSAMGTIVGVTVGSSAAYLKHHDWDIRSSGIVRFGRATVTAARVVADYKLSLRHLDPEMEEYWTTKSEVHLRSAKRLKDLCCKNRGAFIKVGQHLAALDYLLPKEYTETLKVLHSDAPRSTIEEVYRVLREDFKQEVDDVFTHFDEFTCGTASLAQVHRAVLKDGTPVAVKVQHPKVKAHSAVDMVTMDILVHIVAKLFPEFQLLWLSEETKKNLPLELDFFNEGKNCEKLGKMMEYIDSLKVPKIHWDLTTERVLTMEYCHGGQVNDKAYMESHDVDVNQVSRELGKIYSEMIFKQGYIHCDPHPGNVLVNKTNGKLQIVLLDHGLYQTLSDDFRIKYCKLWVSLINGDLNTVKSVADKLGVGKHYGLFACIVTARSWTALQTGIKKTKFTKEEDDLIKATAAEYLTDITEILNDVPREMLLILKTNDLLRGIESTLNTRSNARSFLTMSRFCVTALKSHQRKKCRSLLCRVQVSLSEQYELLKLTLYEIVIWLRDYSFLMPHIVDKYLDLVP